MSPLLYGPLADFTPLGLGDMTETCVPLASLSLGPDGLLVPKQTWTGQASHTWASISRPKVLRGKNPPTLSILEPLS